MIPSAGQWGADISGWNHLLWSHLREVPAFDLARVWGFSPVLATRLLRLTPADIALLANSIIPQFMPSPSLAPMARVALDDAGYQAEQAAAPLRKEALLNYIGLSYVRERVLADEGTACALFRLPLDLGRALAEMSLDAVRRVSAVEIGLWMPRGIRTLEIRSATVEAGFFERLPTLDIVSSLDFSQPAPHA